MNFKCGSSPSTLSMCHWFARIRPRLPRPVTRFAPDHQRRCYTWVARKSCFTRCLFHFSSLLGRNDLAVSKQGKNLLPKHACLRSSIFEKAACGRPSDRNIAQAVTALLTIHTRFAQTLWTSTCQRRTPHGNSRGHAQETSRASQSPLTHNGYPRPTPPSEK